MFLEIFRSLVGRIFKIIFVFGKLGDIEREREVDKFG